MQMLVLTLLTFKKVKLIFGHPVHGDCEQAMEGITLCISDINKWMLHNKLQLNQDKTEFFVVASPRVLNLASNIKLTIDGTIIKPSISVRNLGVTFDATMNMSIHISNLRKTQVGNGNTNGQGNKTH